MPVGWDGINGGADISLPRLWGLGARDVHGYHNLCHMMELKMMINAEDTSPHLLD